MGKRSNFTRRKHDKYATPPQPVWRLLPHLARNVEFIEPCAGNGALVSILERHGHRCVYACDIKPGREWIDKQDATRLRASWSRRASVFITNPPWTRSILHRLIDRLPSILNTYMLFDADWMHTVQAEPYLDRCALIISAGRVKWIPGTKGVGKENCCWYYFPKNHTGGPRIIGLTARH